MSYCLNPSCPNPQNPLNNNFCVICGAKLLLKDRYRALKPLGQGGFGKTFLAVDEDKPSKPRCVIKQFFPQAQGTNTVQKAAELFEREAIRLDELGRHSQIPELLAFFSQDNQQYLVQEFIKGEDLAQELARRGPFSEDDIRCLLREMLSILQFVHSHNVIHRDVKPENIIRCSPQAGKLFLVDFGASKAVTAASMRQTGTVIGSAGYLAPEQAIGRAEFASDIYSLGVTCIHLLTGLHPFDLFDVNQGSWVWRNYLKRSVSDSLGQILDKMLEAAIGKRYSSAAAVLNDLNRVGTTLQSVSTPVPSTSVSSGNRQLEQLQIDLELEQLRAEIMGEGQANSPPKSASPHSSGSSGQSDIDLELEELKSEFLGSSQQEKG
ncbi:MAG: protein kinase domain-containing protein [Chroococcales cyanobacterium]